MCLCSYCVWSAKYESGATLAVQKEQCTVVVSVSATIFNGERQRTSVGRPHNTGCEWGHMVGVVDNAWQMCKHAKMLVRMSSAGVNNNGECKDISASTK